MANPPEEQKTPESGAAQNKPEEPKVSEHSPEGIYKKFEQQREAAGESVEGRLKAANEAVKALQDYISRRTGGFEKLVQAGPDILAGAAKHIGAEENGEVLEMLKAGNQKLLEQARVFEQQARADLAKMISTLVKEKGEVATKAVQKSERWQPLMSETGRKEKAVEEVKQVLDGLKVGGRVEFGTHSQGNSLIVEKVADNKFDLTGVVGGKEQSLAKGQEPAFDKEENGDFFGFKWPGGEYRNIREFVLRPVEIKTVESEKQTDARKELSEEASQKFLNDKIDTKLEVPTKKMPAKETVVENSDQTVESGLSATAEKKSKSDKLDGYRQMYEEDDLATLQGVMTEITRSFGDLAENDQARRQEQSALQKLADEVMIKKEAELQKDFVEKYGSLSNSELKSKEADLVGKLLKLENKRDKIAAEDPKGDKVRIDCRKKESELRAVEQLLGVKKSLEEKFPNKIPEVEFAKAFNVPKTSEIAPPSVSAISETSNNKDLPPVESVPGSDESPTIDFEQNFLASKNEKNKQEENIANSAADFLLKRIKEVNTGVKKEIESAVNAYLESAGKGDANVKSAKTKDLLRIYARELKSSKKAAASEQLPITQPTDADRPAPVTVSEDNEKRTESDSFKAGVEKTADGTEIDPNSNQARETVEGSLVGRENLSDEKAKRIKAEIERNYGDNGRIDSNGEATPAHRTLVEAEWEGDEAVNQESVITFDTYKGWNSADLLSEIDRLLNKNKKLRDQTDKKEEFGIVRKNVYTAIKAFEGKEVELGKSFLPEIKDKTSGELQKIKAEMEVANPNLVNESPSFSQNLKKMGYIDVPLEILEKYRIVSELIFQKELYSRASDENLELDLEGLQQSIDEYGEAANSDESGEEKVDDEQMVLRLSFVKFAIESELKSRKQTQEQTEAKAAAA